MCSHNLFFFPIFFFFFFWRAVVGRQWCSDSSLLSCGQVHICDVGPICADNFESFEGWQISNCSRWQQNRFAPPNSNQWGACLVYKNKRKQIRVGEKILYLKTKLASFVLIFKLTNFEKDRIRSFSLLLLLFFDRFDRIKIQTSKQNIFKT